VKRFAILGALLVAPVFAHDMERPALDYVPPPPRSYVLHRIMPAPEGRLLGLDGREQPLSRYTREQITLLGFIYTTCVDPQGCPLAYKVLDAFKQAIESTAAAPRQSAVRDAVLRSCARHARRYAQLCG
jgi:hypothetical protein